VKSYQRNIIFIVFFYKYISRSILNAIMVFHWWNFAQENPINFVAHLLTMFVESGAPSIHYSFYKIFLNFVILVGVFLGTFDD